MSNPLTQVQVRRALAASFTSANPTLSAAEAGWESDTNKLKIGDGVTVWTSLPYWTSPAPTKKLFQFAIPMVIPSNGTIGNNGALSGITALPKQYASCYMFFPANAIAAGVAAGFYYVTMSSTTAGTIFNNLYSSGAPTIPGSPTAFSTTGPGAYTQVTTAQTALTLTITGNTIGATGQLFLRGLESSSNTAQTKTLAFAFGGSTAHSFALTTTDSGAFRNIIANRGVTGAQVSESSADFGPTGGGAATVPQYLSVDTTISRDITCTMQLAATPASNWLALESLRVTLV